VNLADYNKILIIRLSSLGDILLTTPLLRTLKNKFPKSIIDFLLREQYIDAIVNNPHINSIIPISRNYKHRELKKKILENSYDLIIDLQNNFRSRKILSGTASEVVRFHKPWFKKFVLVKLKLNLFKEIIPIPVRYAKSIPEFSLDDNGLEIYTNLENGTDLSKNENYIGFCPGSRHKTKMWPEEYFIKLGKLLTDSGKKVMLFGGRDDLEVCKKISESIPNSFDLSNDN